MLTRLDISLNMNNKNTYDANMGSILHGFLMENISKEFSKEMHRNQLHSYSQYIIKYGEQLIWTINTLDSDAKNEIITGICTLDSVSLKHREENIIIEKKEIKSITYDQLFEKFYIKRQAKSIKFKFITPTSFKCKGEYMIYPTVRLIFQSLMNKFNDFSKDIGVSCDEFLPLLEEVLILKNYNLRSNTFSLEGIRVPSFCGELEYFINAPQHIINMVHMLAEFGTYSGVGIKTSMGMGGIKVTH
ncbi:CRISPR-associated endoribonuclease Cas6 [Lachnoanaerobaculum sp. OBRC5-5]|uniref:CRISPR-associated endoribonuclease Cas6 n=1 Tax=Lachnoanaerobaculum sp. OBRC5-5 TaxID=936595 RepID=UPI0002824FDE|nr:CRISPR-associated endoribonuclease Cas6 [Lachnoanaerobaculum sp. OBRC5-5]EJZ68962.1 CRISPR-associated endoribonuclease cas6 [Lachnoanaerobaculum sp. OBRC5-5]